MKIPKPLIVGVAMLAVAVLSLGLGAYYFGSLKAFAAVLRGEHLVVDFPGPNLGGHKSGTTFESLIRLQNLSRNPINVIGINFRCTCITTSVRFPLEVSAHSTFDVPMLVHAVGKGSKEHMITVYADSQVRMEYAAESLTSLLVNESRYEPQRFVELFGRRRQCEETSDGLPKGLAVVCLLFACTASAFADGVGGPLPAEDCTGCPGTGNCAGATNCINLGCQELPTCTPGCDCDSTSTKNPNCTCKPIAP